MSESVNIGKSLLEACSKEIQRRQREAEQQAVEAVVGEFIQKAGGVDQVYVLISSCGKHDHHGYMMADSSFENVLAYIRETQKDSDVSKPFKLSQNLRKAKKTPPTFESGLKIELPGKYGPSWVEVELMTWRGLYDYIHKEKSTREYLDNARFSDSGGRGPSVQYINSLLR